MRRDYTDWTPQYNPKSGLSSEPSVTAAGDRHGVPDAQLANGGSEPKNLSAAAEPTLPSISEKPENGSAAVGSGIGP